MKKFVLVSLFLILLLNGFCQKYGIIEGVIYDSIENEGIAYVNLLLVKADLGTFSDEEGKFIFNNVPAGEDILKCSLVGYGTPKRLNIRIFEDSIVYIKINLAQCEYQTLGQRNCPICNKLDETIPILYGEPTKKSIRKAEKGKIWLGGCTITHCDPHWYCKRDMVKF